MSSDKTPLVFSELFSKPFEKDESSEGSADESATGDLASLRREKKQEALKSARSLVDVATDEGPYADTDLYDMPWEKRVNTVKRAILMCYDDSEENLLEIIKYAILRDRTTLKLMSGEAIKAVKEAKNDKGNYLDNIVAKAKGIEPDAEEKSKIESSKC